jgi:hypothetical protein
MENTYSQPRKELICVIKVRGALDRHWSTWFDGLAITTDENGDTVMTGALPDPAALFGIINRVRDLGLELLAVCRD